MRRNRTEGITRRRFGWCILLLTIAWLGIATSQEASSELELCSPSNVEYDWQRWNYYELLNLPRPPTPGSTNGASSLDTKSLRKAYRKQAQLWHPDKHNSNSTDATSQAESTARFARIAEAYEVLGDEWKRKEYDLFLRYCDDLQEEQLLQQQTGFSSSYKQKWSKLFSNFGDPLRVFEEFLFGKDGLKDDDDEDDWFFDMPRQKSEPIRITKFQDVIRDPYGEDIVRISQMEEYAPEPSATGNGKYYYRIVSQDFTKRFDPYTGAVSLDPLTHPYLREEGYRQQDPRRSGTKEEENSRQSLLFPGDILTPKSALIVSPNGRYYAGVSADCELLVMADNGFGKDTLFWSSGDSIQSTKSYFQEDHYNRQNQQQSSCFATLRGPHLVVAVGRPQLPHRILWYSEAPDELMEGDNPNYGLFQSSPYSSSPSTYLAQLDNDGSLVVYKVWAPVPNFEHLPLSARAWIATRNFLIGATREDQQYEALFGSSPFGDFGPITTYKRCVYATGPLGCFRVARRLYQLSLDIYYNIKSIVGKIDAMFDTWMDLILEEDDYLRIIKERSTNGFDKQIVAKSARLVRRVLELVTLRDK